MENTQDSKFESEVLEVLEAEISSLLKEIEAAKAVRPRLLDPSGAAQYLSLSEGYLANLRRSNKGPDYIKFKGFIRYEIHDLESWVNKQTRH